MPRILSLLLIVSFLTPALAGEPTRLPIPDGYSFDQDLWYGAYARESKVGHGHMVIEKDGDVVRSTHQIDLKMVAMGQKMTMSIIEQQEFSITGPLIKAHAKMVQNGQTLDVNVVRKDDGYLATISDGGPTRELPLPELDYELSDVVCLELWLQGKPELGAELSVRTFSMSDLVHDVDTHVLEKIERSLVDGVPLTYYELSVTSERDKDVSTLRTDALGRILSGTIGGLIEIRMEPEHLARDYDYSADIFFMGTARIDHGIGDPRGVPFLVMTTENDGDKIPSYGKQRVTTENGITTIAIGEGEHAEAMEEEISKALEETLNHPISDPAIQAMAKEVTAGASNRLEQVVKLVHHVEEFVIDDYSAQPLTVQLLLEKRRGDCTEHSMLFTTLARAIGIPTREVSGLVYMGDEFKAFGGHAWNEVVIDGRWIPVDTTWGETDINATHIRFGADDEATGFAAFSGFEFKLVEPQPDTSEQALPNPIEDETVTRVASKVVSTLQKDGYLGSKPPTVRVASAAEIEAHLAVELEAQLKNRFDAEMAKSEAEGHAWMLSQVLFAKYVFASNEVLVCTQNIAHMSALAEMPDLCSEVTLCALVTHELVHARDHEEFDVFAAACACKTLDESMALNAVIEGHAQYEARRLCEKYGWSQGFDNYTSLIGTVPGAEEMDEATRFMARNLAVNEAAAYNDGERFIAALQAKGGKEAVARAFQNPPTEMNFIYHPDWFLHPDQRPTYEFNVVDGLASFRGQYPEEQWVHTLLGPSRPQLEAAFGLLPKQEVSDVLDAVKQCHLVILQPKTAPASKMITAALFEHDSVANARKFMGIEEKLLNLKDETMKEGAIRITASSMQEISGRGWNGIESNKTVVVGLETVKVKTVVAVHERLAVEMSYSGHEISRQDLANQVQALFDGALSTSNNAAAPK